jgi:hypothetical protein
VKKKLYLSVIILALCLVGWTGHGREQRTSAGRQTWEYRVDGAPTFAGPGSYIDPEKAQQLLNQRGAEGWELTAIGGGQGLYYFRRPR